ncbi:MAG: PAS domain S-box protein [Prosthecochloris sp.]|nr:PAS domain S-box protein [Prosthecochloris sp.]
MNIRSISTQPEGFGDDTSPPASSMLDIHYHLLWNNLSDGLFLHSVADNLEPGKFELVNASACRILGYAQEELLEMGPRELDDPELATSYIPGVMQQLAAEGQVVFEAVHLHKNGMRIPVEICSRRIEINSVRYILSSARYRTNRLQPTQELTRSNERLQLIMKKAHAGSWEWDIKTNSNIWSDELWTLYGLDASNHEASYESWLSAIIAEDRLKTEKIVQHASTRGEEFTIEWRVRDHGGSYRWLMSKGTPLKDHTGTISRYIGMVIDITERKTIEEEKLLLEQQVQQSQKMELVGQLAGGIAHDFNNMLAVILGNTELTIDRLGPETSPKLLDDLNSIHQAATRSANLTRQLLAFAQKQTITLKTLDINGLIESMLSMLKPLIGENIRLEWQPGGPEFIVRIDPSQIDQILANLCVNARDAIERNGTILITTERVDITRGQLEGHEFCSMPGTYVRLTVRDNGKGISPKHLPHIFEPFFTTKTTGTGTGLGLSTVYGIVKQNGGYIDCSSSKKSGTSFRILLPLHEPSPENISTREPLLKKRLNDKKRTVLIVEDEPAILAFCSKLLEHEGHHVLQAGLPSEALRIAQDSAIDIDLLLSDIVLPEMNGYELSRQLQLSRPGLKALFMSGYTADILERHGRNGQAVDFICKPFSIRELQEKVEELLVSIT